MDARQLPPVEILRKLLDYDRETGTLTWKPRSVDMFAGARYPAARLAKAWNTRFAGQIALNCRKANGYLHGAIENEFYLAHRVAWKIETGEEPGEIDHANGVRDDNRFANLSSGTRATNMRNRGISSNNTSGVLGVYREASTGKWCAHIEHGAVKRAIGRFDTIEQAAEARKNAEREAGFHVNHGDGHRIASAILE
jgi:hypothetical protein